MTLLALGLNHQTAPIALREKLAIAPSALPTALRELMAQPGVSEAALLSTCNRTEIYCRVEPDASGFPAHWLAQFGQLAPEQLDAYLYRHHDGAAVRHLFRVATGLDSMVLGEPQILGQVKEAWQMARSAGALKTRLDRLFQQTFAVAKRARTDTGVGMHPVSVAFAAVRLAQRTFSSLDQATVLLIGAGDTIELAARHLIDHKVKRLLIANRTLEHAQALASRFGGMALPLNELGRHLGDADVILSATASRDPILDRDMVLTAVRQRRHRPMFLLDLAVPRDFDPTIAELDDVFLYSVDDLEHVIDENRRSRREAANLAEAIIDLQVEHYLGWWRAADEQETLHRFRQRGEDTRNEVLTRAKALLQRGRSPEDALEYLAHTLTNKLLHAPSVALREAAQQGDRSLLRSAERLLDITKTQTNDTEHPAKTRRSR